MITLATLSQATEQEVFDQVANHLLTQLEKSISDEICSYRNEEGLKCAAGCLISDQEYKQSMESMAWGALANQGRVPDAHRNLIGILQATHDFYPVEGWAERLRQIAKERDLIYKAEEYGKPRN